VDKLVADLGLELAAGQVRAANPVRWVHISGEVDPTTWLSGGELLLTSGAQLRGDEDRARFIDRLAAHDLAVVGVGLDESMPGAPRALIEQADRAGFPLFDVPWSMPFITITETAMPRLVNERYDILRRGVVVQQALENLVLEGRGLGEIVATIGAAVGGTVAILDIAGGPLACHDPGGLLGPAALASVGAQVVAREGDPRPSSRPIPASPRARSRAR
jgi:PucR family transcriptional regulator, purine catabolism regulatory protein